MEQEGAVNLALYAIVERDAQAVVVQGFNTCDSQHQLLMLGQWFDRCEGLQRLCVLPVVGELVGMQARPLPDQPERA